MTVLITGTVEFDADTRERVLREAATLMLETRTQKGCRHYVWSADPSSDSRVYVLENWASSEDLCAHLAGPYYAQMLGLLTRFQARNADVSKFKIALEEPVYDPEGRPRGDFFTE